MSAKCITAVGNCETVGENIRSTLIVLLCPSSDPRMFEAIPLLLLGDPALICLSEVVTIKHQKIPVIESSKGLIVFIASEWCKSQSFFRVSLDSIPQSVHLSQPKVCFHAARIYSR